MGLDEGLFVGRNILLDWDGLVAGRHPVVMEGGLQLVEVEIEAFCYEREVGVDVSILLADEEAGDGGIIVDQQAAFAIQELAAKTGIQPSEVSSALTQILPQVVSHLTPNGQVPQAAELEQTIGGLLQKLGGQQ